MGATPGPLVADINYDWCNATIRKAGSDDSIIADVRRTKQFDVIARLFAASPALCEAATDALAGWRYIRQHHGDLYGVEWDRVETALTAALAKANPATLAQPNGPADPAADEASTRDGEWRS